MIKFTIKEYCENGVMITRHEPIDPPVPGLPPNHTSTITMKKSELNLLINMLSEYGQTK